MCPGSKGGQQHPGLYDQEHGRRTREGVLWNTPSRFHIPSPGMVLAGRSGFSTPAKVLLRRAALNHFQTLSNMGATLAYPLSQETSAIPVTFQKGYSKDILIYPCNFITTVRPVIWCI